MTFHLYEDTWETSTTTGTGDYVLGGAASGWRPFSAQYVDTNTTWYSAFDGINFEHGIGTYNSGPNTLSRTTVLRSTNGGNPVVWTSGVRHIVCAPLGAMLEKLNPPISAQMLDIDPLRLAAVGTKLKALGPLTILNSVSATTINAALDGAVNIYQGTAGDCVWNLPPVQPGMCLNIMLGNMQHNCIITPNAADQITGPPNTGYMQSSPLTIPPCLNGNYSSITFVGAPHNWLMEAIGPPIAEAMGWVMRPYFDGYYSGATLAPASITWTKIPLQNSGDSHGWFDAVNLRYVPKRAGTYQFTIIVTLGDVTTGQAKEAHVALYKNSALNVQKYEGWNGTNYLPQVVTVTLSTTTGANGTTDYFEAFVYINAPNPFVQGGATTGCEMIIRYLGP